MGGFNPITTVLSTATGLISATQPLRKAYGNYRDDTAAYRQAQTNYQESERENAEKTALAQQRAQADSDEAARQRKDALRRAVAKQQAAFGGQGIDTTDGSGEAVMLGLFKDSEADKAYRDKLDQLRTTSLDQDSAAASRRNLLALNNGYDKTRDNMITNLDNYF